MPRHYSPSAEDYQRWLSAHIWVTGLTKESRRSWIPDFTESLTSWMKKNGYSMNGSWGPKAVAKWLYAIQVQEVGRMNLNGPITYPDPQHRDWQEDRDTFETYITLDDIQKFLEGWRNVEDVDQNLPQGQRVVREMQEFLYTYLDLESSKHGKRIARIMAEANTESDSDGEYHSEIVMGKDKKSLW